LECFILSFLPLYQRLFSPQFFGFAAWAVSVIEWDEGLFLTDDERTITRIKTKTCL